MRYRRDTQVKYRRAIPKTHARGGLLLPPALAASAPTLPLPASLLFLLIAITITIIRKFADGWLMGDARRASGSLRAVGSVVVVPVPSQPLR